MKNTMKFVITASVLSLAGCVDMNPPMDDCVPLKGTKTCLAPDPVVDMSRARSTINILEATDDDWVQTKTEVKPETESEPEVEVEVEVKPETEPEVEVEVETESEPEVEVETPRTDLTDLENIRQEMVENGATAEDLTEVDQEIEKVSIRDGGN